MEFKVPMLPSLPKKPHISKTLKQYGDLPLTRTSGLDILNTIGKGSFGIVKLCKKIDGSLFIIKELLTDDIDDEDDDGTLQKMFIKEAKLLNSLTHDNIVKFDSMLEPKGQGLIAYLMEYIKFDFNVLKLDLSTSSLKELLSVLNKVDFKGYEHFQDFIARDISTGLAYLHQMGIAHRDLKPENILVSNQHYDSDNFHLFWETRPLIAKLTDFGEARTNLIQTASIIHTRTNRVARGSPIYMAPEIHTHDGRTSFGLEDLKRTDIWSISMVFFLLLNPDMKYPYFDDVNNLVKAGVSGMEAIMKNIVSKNKLPAHSSKYEVLRKTRWSTVLKTFDTCCSLISHRRPSAEEILSHLQVECSSEKEEETAQTDNQSVGQKTDRNIFNDFLANEMVGPATQNSLKSHEVSIHSQDISVSGVIVIDGDDNITQAATTFTSERLHKSPARNVPSDDMLKAKSDLTHPSSNKAPAPRTVIAEPTLSEKKTVITTIVEEPTLLQQQGQAEEKVELKDTIHLCEEEEEELPVYLPDGPQDPLGGLPQLQHGASWVAQTPTEGKLTGQTATTTSVSEPVGECQIENLKSRSFCQEAFIRTRVLGNFHQASRDKFRHSAVGSQCSSMCISAIVAAAVFPPTYWDADDLDAILMEGDRRHLEILSGKGWPLERRETKLGIDEMQEIWDIEINGKRLTAKVEISSAKYDLLKNSASLVDTVLKCNENTPCILRLYDSYVAVLSGDNNSFYVFDSHARNRDGEVNPDGASCLLHFQTRQGLIQYIKLQARTTGSMEQFDVFLMAVNSISVSDVNQEADDGPHTEMFTSHPIASNGPEKEMTPEIEACMVLSGEDDGTDTSDEEIDDEEVIYGRYPVYQKRQKGLGVVEILSICVDETIDDDKICRSVPCPKSNSVFVVNLNNVNEKDLSCDDSGPYNKHSSPTVVVEATFGSNKQLKLRTISRKPIPKNSPILTRKDVYSVKRMYSERTDELGRGKLTRIITKVSSCSGLEKLAIIQYLGTASNTNRPHGNSKDRKRAYIRTKPSVIDKEKELLQSEPPKKVIHLIEEGNGGPLNMTSASDGPRDRRQCYNVKGRLQNRKRIKNTGPVTTPNFERLIASMDAGHFLRNVDFSFRAKHNRIHPNTFAMSENAVTAIQSFCSPDSQNKSQLGIDMTYRVGPFYTTCLSFVHPYFVHRNNTEQHPTIFAGMMTSTGRQEQDYRYLATQLKSCGIKHLIYGTDGELALEMGLESVYPIECVKPSEKSIKLRCFNHVKDDMLAVMKKIPECQGREKEIITGILGSEFNTERSPGLVDSEDYIQDYEKISMTWPRKFKDYIESGSMRIRPLKDTLLKSMGKEVRIAAGLGNPPNKFDNQRAESINNILKDSIGNQFVDQSAVHDMVYENVVKPQESELVKAFYGSGEYKLVDSLGHFEVSNMRWKCMTEHQRKNHTNKVLHCTIEETRPERAITRKLSVQPDDCGENLRSMPPALIKKLWEKAEILMSNDSVRELQSGNVCIAEPEAAFIVRADKKALVCTCNDYQKIRLCAHILVVADCKNCLHEYISRFHYSPSGAVNRHNTKGAGEKRTKKPRRGSQNVKKLPILRYTPTTIHSSSTTDVSDVDLKSRRPFQFCEIWHNDELFKVINVSSTILKARKSLKCASCANIISRINAVPPYDILISHLERFMYPTKTGDGRVEWKPSLSKMVTRVYCVRRRCLLSRHPYFWLGQLSIKEVQLTMIHKELLNEEFGCDFN